MEKKDDILYSTGIVSRPRDTECLEQLMDNITAPENRLNNYWLSVYQLLMNLYAHTTDDTFKETDVLSVKWSSQTHTSTDFSVALQCPTMNFGKVTFLKTNHQMANTLFHNAITEQLPKKLLNFLSLKSHQRPNQPPTNKAALWKENIVQDLRGRCLMLLKFPPGVNNKTQRQTQLDCFQHTERGWILNGIA